MGRLSLASTLAILLVWAASCQEKNFTQQCDLYVPPEAYVVTR